MDGNNSLKRVATSASRSVGDTRTFDSDYYIPRAVVEKFAGEVKPRQAQPHVAVPIHSVPETGSDDGDEDGDDPGDNDLTEGDSMDGAPDSACASNWKAAASDEKKRMWAVFEETGVFAAACHHGFGPGLSAKSSGYQRVATNAVAVSLSLIVKE